jgi:hypothetical protein
MLLLTNRQIEQLADEEALLVRFWGEPVGLSMAYDRVVPRATGWRGSCRLLFNAFLDVEGLRRDEPRAARYGRSQTTHCEVLAPLCDRRSPARAC